MQKAGIGAVAQKLSDIDNGQPNSIDKVLRAARDAICLGSYSAFLPRLAIIDLSYRGLGLHSSGSDGYIVQNDSGKRHYRGD